MVTYPSATFVPANENNENKKKGTVFVSNGPTTTYTNHADADELVWDSIFVHFDVSIFIHQLVLHLFLPLTVWMSPSAKCQVLMWDKNATWTITFQIIAIFAINMTSFVSFIFYMTMDAQDRDHFFGSLAYPLVFMLLWKISVAVKYASFSPTEYKRVMTFKSWDRVGAFFAQTLINQNLIATQVRRSSLPG